MREPAVLLVDDERVTIATSRILAADYDVTATSDPKHALAMVGSGLRFEAILCDLAGSTMTGCAFHAELVGLDPAQAKRIVFFTSTDVPVELSAYLEVNRIRVIRKPASTAEIRQVVQETCSSAAW